MDTIAFIDANDKSGTRILINGRELIDIVREIEQPFAEREGHPNLPGAYGYFGPMFVFSPARHFLGEPANDWTDGAGRIYVLSCNCGIPECWPLSARIEITEDKIIWSNFRQRHRGPNSPQGEWRYDKLGPFTFDRQSYEQALASYKSADFPPSAKDSRKSLPPDPHKIRLTEIFNHGFRRGANDRAASGSKPSSERQPPKEIPPFPEEYRESSEQMAWTEGYSMGYQVGASDAELASVDVPGAHGMIAGMGPEMMEMFGAFKKMSDESNAA